jgi:DNA-binding NtrC family response regulator
VDPAKVLVVDDERSILLLLKEALSQWGYQVTVAASAAEALGLLKSELFDALITDIRMPDMSGLELLREVKKQDESIEVVMMTGYPTIASAVQALKEGAYDYLSKPLILDELRHLMSRMMERKFLRGEVSTLRARLGEELTVNELIGTSVPMERVKEIIGKVAVTDSPVLIEGESGTGKELVAAAIHRLSSRAKRSFIPVNCSAIPQDLLESEFFGHVRGAFSGAVADALGLFRGADEGTIFLDEIAELSPALQVKLLRVLQEMQVRPVGSTKAYPVDVRVIAATNRDLERAMTEGSFRQDLFYRLNVVRITLPPLRERRDDIPVLARHFLDKYSPSLQMQVSQGAMRVLMAFSWPGNVRQLENAIERAVTLSSGRKEIDLPDLPPEIQAVPEATTAPFVEFPDDGLDMPAYLTSIEKDLIRRSLQRTGGNRNKAAELLRIKRTTLVEKLKRLGPD